MTNDSEHTGLGIALGAALGAALGLMAGHIAVWLAIGVVIGVAIGGTARRKGSDCPDCAELHRAHATRKRSQQADRRSLTAGS